jgi:lipopolysaccharide export LptBFGC system permease protein LptF
VLGVATGLLLQSGSMLGALATAVGYALVYYLLAMRAGKALAVSGAVPQWVAAWAMTAAGTLVGIALLFKALRR